jgi:hypothetical protein
MGNEAFLYFAYELGKQRARDSWEDYLPAIRSAYEKGLNEDANTDNKLAKLLTRFINQNEGADRAVASDAIEYIKKMGHMEQFATSLDYFVFDLDEGRAGFNPIRDKEDYLDKRDHLFKQMNLPMMSQQDKEVIKQRILDLDSEATKLKLINQSLKQEDSYNHMYNRGVSEAQKKFPKASQEVIHEWATKWAKAHGGQLNENKHEYVLYIDNKPAAKYQQENDALRDIAQLKKSRPESVLDLKREVCNLETIKHIAEGQSIFNENQFDHLTSKRLKSILLAPQANAQTLEWAMDFTEDALRADYDDEGIDSRTFDARNKAYEQAAEAFYDQDGEINPGADLDATLAHLKQFWSV